MARAKLVQCFLDTDMRCQHNGLSEIAKNSGVDVNKLRPGNHVIFVNSALDKMKMYSPGGVLSYLKMTGKRKIDLRTVNKIPEAFTGGDFTMAYSRSIRSVLTERILEKTKK